MAKHVRVFRKIPSVLLIGLMLVNILASIPLTADAAVTTKEEKSYEIAVVFDNSGSMYSDSLSWCRAKYAMEIFASMLSYDSGDKLKIYPMWKVTTNGSKQESDSSYEPVEINNKDDIDKISKLYTVYIDSERTPFEPVTEAFSDLTSSNATDKWIVVLTDGAFTKIKRADADIENYTIPKDELQSMLFDVAKDGIKVQYLGFGGALPLDSKESDGFYAKVSSDTSLKDDLIGICNTIFQRSELKDSLNGTSLDIDLSMKNLIVFAQGSNAKIASLTDESGNEIPITLDSGQRKYSEISAKGYDGSFPEDKEAPVDKTLAGQVVTFAACPKGKYTLHYSDADKIQVFYEPDVDIEVTLTDSDGEVVDPSSGKIKAGVYTINSKIIDSNSKDDVTAHKLMGENVKLATFVKTSADSDYTEYENGAAITFKPDNACEVYVEGTYLEKYKISTKDDPNAFPLPIIIEPSVEFVINAEVLQKGNWYTLKDHDAWKPVKVGVLINGEAATEAQMAQIDLVVESSSELPYRCETAADESAFYIYIGTDEAGKYIQPETGKYTLKFDGTTYLDELGETHTIKNESVSFEVQKYAKIWRVLIWILAFLLLFILWLIFMSQKVLPKGMDKNPATAELETVTAGKLGGNFVGVDYRRKSQSLRVYTQGGVDFSEKCNATFKLRPVDSRFTKPKDRRIKIVGINSNCSEISINGTPYNKNDKGVWVKATAIDATNPPPIAQETKNPIITLQREFDATLTCKVENK